MIYFNLRGSLSRTVAGKHIQAEFAEYFCDIWEDPKFIDHANVSFKKVDFEPITAKAILVKKAKLTDYINPRMVGFSLKPLVSGKLKSILEITGNEGMQFHRSPVIYQGNEIEDYWVLNPFLLDMDTIDFSKARVYVMERTVTKVEQLPIVNFKDYEREKKAVDDRGYPYSIYIENVHILDGTTSDFLILEKVQGGVMYLASERLKQHLEAEGITGIEFQPCNLSLNEWLAQGGPREKLYGKI
ncbi:hypothetical protein INP83_03900 [Mucilaginibacter sp. 21P]|uniref:hypothetical protein n=1 Tax=Mucilaginibacter sp. 21P TaxID=2778902 RepID=UPI001C55D05D|nr:hypothetical protein [Mucilaginibacter sp. 21P]QXV66243.1 hypothetical protein INP83_03900 [Mucilaginibacter sp. 21P]